MTFAMSCCCSRSNRSVRRPLSRCIALLTRVRNSSAASSRARSAVRSRPSSSSDRPRTSWSHPNAWISRRPPPPSFNSGSSRYAAEPNRVRRSRASFARLSANPSTSPRSRARTGPEASLSSSGVAGQQPGIEHRGRRIQAFRRQLHGLARRPDGVTHGEAGVPERIQQLLRQRGDGGGLRPVVHQHDVDVRPRAEGAAPVAAERDQRRARRPVPGGGRGRVQLDERGIDQLRAPSRRPQAVMARRVGALERGQLVLQPRDGSRNVRRRVPDAHVTGRPDRARPYGSG